MISTIDLENTYTSGVYSKRSVVFERGCGALLIDAEGREYIDCTAGYGVANIGHGRSEIAATLAAQAQRLITCPEIFYNDVRARLLERLAHLVPQGLTHIFLCNSGTEAVEGALKFARIATGRTGIVATLRGFHGRTMGALSTTWEPHYREPFVPLVPDVSHIRYNDLAAAEAVIGEQTAAVIIELVQGEGGVHVATEQYVHGLAALCRERGALLIVDEVQTGFGRTGRLFACNHYDLRPDILCLAKSLAGGVPMGAVCLGQRVMESGRITRGIHGSTFGGNPLACAAALTTLDILEREALPERAAALGNRAFERLRTFRTPLIREVRGRGLLLGIELSKRAQPFLEALFERGVLALQAGPNVIRLLPPLVITEEQLERTLDVVEEVLVGQVMGDGSRVNARVTVEVSAGVNERVTVGVNERMSAEVSERVTVGANERMRAEVSAGMNERVTARVTPTIHECVGEADLWCGGDPFSQQGCEEVSLLRNMLMIPSYSGEENALAQHLLEQAQQMGLYACIDGVGNFIASTDPHVIEAEMERGISGVGICEGGREGDVGDHVGLLATREGDVGDPRVLSPHPHHTRPYGDGGDVREGGEDDGDGEDVGNGGESGDVEEGGGDGMARPIVLLGHMDTVRGNIPVRLQDGVLYGRGAVDAKGPLAAFLCATARLAQGGHVGALEHPIVVIGAVEEESATSRGAHAVVERYRPCACIIGEPSGSQAVTIGYKGRLLVEYCVTRSIQHSAGPQQNSNEAAVAFWHRVQQYAADWNQQHAADSTFAALMPSLRSMQSDQDGLEERARLFIGYRLPPGYDTAGLRTKLERWAVEDEAQLNFTGEEMAFQTTRTTPLARAFIASIRATGRQPSFKHKTGTSDMNVVGPVWGQNILAYGPGDSHLDHTPQEHIHISEYIHAIDVLELVLSELALGGRVTP